MSNDITPYEPEQHNVVVQRNAALMQLRDHMFQVGLHYGEPFKGSGKPTLLKPGAEIILARFKLWPDFIDRGCVERWDGDAPVFHYRYECKLRHRETGEIWGAGLGSCNSMEDKYRWRKQERTCPECGAAAIKRSRYPENKPQNQRGWYCHTKAGGCNAKFAPDDERITSQSEGKVPNDEVFTLVNTIDKMAQKRALVAAVLVATGASTYFTQDVEDFPGYAGEIIDVDLPVIVDGDTGEIVDVTPQTKRQMVDAAQDAGEMQPEVSELDTYLGPRDGTQDPYVDDPDVFNSAKCEAMALHMATNSMADHKKHAANRIRKAINRAGLNTHAENGFAPETWRDMSWSEIYNRHFVTLEVWAMVEDYIQANESEA